MNLFRYRAVILIYLVLLASAMGCAPPPSEQASQVVSAEEDLGLSNGSFMVELNGFNIHVEIHGQGPVMMVVPNSWGLSIVGLRGLLQPLEERLTMVYFDPRGMGDSDPVRQEADMSMAAVRADFDSLRQHLGLDQVHAIGWSNGAANLVLLAAEKPESLSSAIFLHGIASYTQEDAAKFAQEQPALMQRYMAFIEEMADESLTDGIRTARMKELWLTDYFPATMADSENGRALLEEVFGEAEFSWAHGQVADQELSTFDAREQLASIPVRSLVIAGAHDMSPPTKVQELADGLPNSVFVVFENSGHFSPIEETEAFTELVFDFLGAESP